MKKIIVVLFAISACSFALGCTISNSCMKFIKDYEKCSLIAYWDANGYSIGYGHHSDVKEGQTITKKQAEEYFRNDIKEAEKNTKYLLSKLPYKYKFSQGFIDGMISMVYNAGIGNIQKSTFYQRLLRCRVRDGKMDVSDFNYTLASVKTTCVSCKGHKERRLDEYKMMMQ